jgi:hypothetical protein
MESEARLGPISESHRHHIREINSLQLPEGRSISQPFVGASKTWSWLSGNKSVFRSHRSVRLHKGIDLIKALVGPRHLPESRPKLPHRRALPNSQSHHRRCSRAGQ